MENCLAISKLVFPCPSGASLQVWTYGEEHHHAGSVALWDVPDGEYMLLQNLQIVASIQGNVLGKEEKTPSVVNSDENAPYHYTLREFHRIISLMTLATS